MSPEIRYTSWRSGTGPRSVVATIAYVVSQDVDGYTVASAILYGLAVKAPRDAHDRKRGQTLARMRLESFLRSDIGQPDLRRHYVGAGPSGVVGQIPLTRVQVVDRSRGPWIDQRRLALAVLGYFVDAKSCGAQRGEVFEMVRSFLMD